MARNFPFAQKVLMICAFLFQTGPCVGGTTASPSDDISATVRKIESASYSDRWRIRLRLDELVSTSKNSDITDADIAAIASLLDMDDDSVHATAATCLMHIGPRARSAIPKLEKALGVVACLTGDLTSEVAVRRTLVSFGVNPPKDACGWSGSNASNNQ